MKVKAVRDGYYGLKRRKVGAEFNLKNPADFSPKWMKKVGAVSQHQEEVEEIQEPKGEPEQSGDDVI
jgi:hypothetical protein